jgi:hypothetical protein
MYVPSQTEDTSREVRQLVLGTRLRASKCIKDEKESARIEQS